MRTNMRGVEGVVSLECLVVERFDLTARIVLDSNQASEHLNPVEESRSPAQDCGPSYQILSNECSANSSL